MRLKSVIGPLLAAGVMVACFGGGSVDTNPVLPNAGSAGQSGFAGLLDGGSPAGGTGNQGDGGTDIDVPPGAGVGDSCNDDEPCRQNLECTGGECVPAGAAQAGDACVISVECDDGLRCLGGACAPAGDGVDGDVCQTDGDCEVGLRCGIVGLQVICTPEGDVDVGGACMGSLDCYSGLACANGSCVPNPTGLPVLPGGSWDGVECDAPGEPGDVSRAYFELPGVASPAGETGDFFRLPFPNDALLRNNGTLDLSDFPTPGPDALGVDAVKLYVDSIDGNEKGWGSSPTVIFRFSNAMDYDTFNPASASDPTPLQWIDVTEGTPEFGQSRGFKWFASGARNNYVCYDYLALRRPDGSPLIPGHTYAVYLSNTIRGSNGDPVERSPQLAALLASATPGDAALAAAHARYAPLRAYMQSEGIAAGDIANATVFTVAATRDLMKDLAAAVEDTAVPTSSGWVQCDTGVASPCPQAEGSRACGAANAAYDEYHALVSLPIFQEGTPPYQDQGGNIVTDAPVRNEDVCIALTVPKGVAMPADGWPLVISGHGTGGSFRSHVNAAVAGALSNVSLLDPPADLADGGPGGDSSVHFAVLGFDAVEHGPRRGNSTESPDNLFFNFLNPDASRGNPLQGAADLISLGRFAEGLNLTAQQSGGDAIKIDPDRIVYLGHSQGSMHGSLALPYADMYKSAVMSGNGASIIHALLNKTSPVNIAQVVPFALQDQVIDLQAGGIRLASGEFHPALTVIGQWIDPSDPMNFGRQLAYEPEPGHTAKHLFQTYGQGDTFAPPVTLLIYALTAQVVAAADHDSLVNQDDDLGPALQNGLIVQLNGGVWGNRTVDGDAITIGLRQYAPPQGSDGHFVAFDVPDANTDVAQFLAMSANGQVPTAGITAE